MHTKTHRALALLTCAIFLSAAIFSVSFLVEAAGHDCAGENCPVCACIQQAEETLKQLGMGTACAVSLIFAAVLLLLSISCTLQTAWRETLVSQKIRLNN